MLAGFSLAFVAMSIWIFGWANSQTFLRIWSRCVDVVVRSTWWLADEVPVVVSTGAGNKALIAVIVWVGAVAWVHYFQHAAVGEASNVFARIRRAFAEDCLAGAWDSLELNIVISASWNAGIISIGVFEDSFSVRGRAFFHALKTDVELVCRIAFSHYLLHIRVSAAIHVIARIDALTNSVPLPINNLDVCAGAGREADTGLIHVLYFSFAWIAACDLIGG